MMQSARICFRITVLAHIICCFGNGVFSIVCMASETLMKTDVSNPDDWGNTQDTADANTYITPETHEERRWFVLVGLVNVYPRLEREQLIKELLDPALQTLAPGYRGTKTFTDMRDDHLLWPPQIAVGRILSRHFALSIHGGYSAGTVHTDKRNPSVLLGVPLYSDVKIRRYATYLGLDLDYYPWGMVEQKPYANWGERLRGMRPTLGARHTWTWAGFDADIRLGLWPFEEAVKVKLNDSWALPNITLVAGLDIPLNQRSAIILNAGYSFFWQEKQDFAGSAFTLGWRYVF